MKKLLLPICAMLLCMTACKKEGNGILTLEMEEYSSDAKLFLDDENYAVWDNGDNIWLNGDQYSVVVNSTKATISDVPENTTYTAIFPYDWANNNTIDYPQTQNFQERGYGQKIEAPMAGFWNMDLIGRIPLSYIFIIV